VDGGSAEKYEGDWSDGKMHGERPVRALLNPRPR